MSFTYPLQLQISLTPALHLGQVYPPQFNWSTSIKSIKSAWSNISSTHTWQHWHSSSKSNFADWYQTSKGLLKSTWSSPLDTTFTSVIKTSKRPFSTQPECYFWTEVILRPTQMTPLNPYLQVPNSSGELGQSTTIPLIFDKPVSSFCHP